MLPTDSPGSRVRPRGAPDAAVNAVTRLFGAGLQADLARYATAVELVVLPAASWQQVPPTTFSRARDLVGQARTTARATLAERARADCA